MMGLRKRVLKSLATKTALPSDYVEDKRSPVVFRIVSKPKSKTGMYSRINKLNSFVANDGEIESMLDAFASFQQDDYAMTDAEAIAISGTAKKNRPAVRAQSLQPEIEVHGEKQ
jgi:hypothetical protein